MNHISNYFKSLQEDICQQLSVADGGTPFLVDAWKRPEGGGGTSMVLHGKKIEKGGVMFSAVEGVLNEKAAKGLIFQLVIFSQPAFLSFYIHLTLSHLLFT